MSDNLAFQEDFREELIGGKVVAMSPAATSHNRIAANILIFFGHYLKGKNCVPFGDGEKVFLTKTDHYVPDFMIVCDPNKIKPDGIHGAPDLVVEVLSPSTAKNDKTIKKDVYAQCGVREYWIVSPGDKSVEQYLLQDGQFVLNAVYALCPDWMLKGMTEDERSRVQSRFKCSLYDDLEIDLEDVFYRTF